jgi:hypothetical protein
MRVSDLARAVVSGQSSIQIARSEQQNRSNSKPNNLRVPKIAFNCVV